VTSPDARLREQLTDLADHAPAGVDLLDGALTRARRRRRGQLAGTGLATAAVAAAVATTMVPSVLPGPLQPGGSPDTRTTTGPSALPSPRRSLLTIGPDVPRGTPSPPAPPAVVGTVAQASALLFHGHDVDAVDAATGNRRRILRLSDDAAGQLPVPNSGSLSPDGTKLAVPSIALGDGFRGVSGVWVLDLPTGEGHLYPTAKQVVGAVSWSPDGTRLWALRWGGGGVWTLDVPDGRFTPVPGVTEPYVFWDGARRLVTSDGGWRTVGLPDGSSQPLPHLAAYDAGGPWAPAEFGGWSPDGRWLAVQGRGSGSSTSFAAVDVSTGRVARSWGPYPDEMVTQNILGWSSPTTMVAMLRPAGSDTALQLTELDVETGRTKVRATYDNADSAYLPAQPLRGKP
jgi:hypothetical protein